MHPILRSGAPGLVLLWLSASLVAAPATPAHLAKTAGTTQSKKLKPALKGRLIRTIPARVTFFYSFKDKKTGKLHPMATVSKPLAVRVVKPKRK